MDQATHDRTVNFIWGIADDRTTVLSADTDPNKLLDLKASLDGWQVYVPEQVAQVADLFLAGAAREALDPILDACVAAYLAQLDEDGQVDFRGKAQAFTRTYDFLASILPYSNAGWERLSIFLNLLVPKLPAPKEEDLSRGILESIDTDSCRVEKQAAQKLALPDRESEVGRCRSPAAGGSRSSTGSPTSCGASTSSSGRCSGTYRVAQRLRDEVAPKVAAHAAYQSAKHDTPQAARLEHDEALARVMPGLLKDDTEVYEQFVQNPSFKRFVTDMIFGLTSGGA